MRCTRIAVAFLAVTAVVAAPAAYAMGPEGSAYAGDPLPAGAESGPAEPVRNDRRWARVAWDILVERPVGFAQTVFSAPWLVVFYPITLLTGGTEDVVEICWTQPVEQTFRRPLGE